MASHENSVRRRQFSRPRAVSSRYCLHAGRDGDRASRSNMKRCYVPGCPNSNTSSVSRGISFFRLPTHVRRARQWLDAIRRKPNPSIMVCEVHFTDRQIHGFKSRKFLTVKAVPSRCLPPRAGRAAAARRRAPPEPPAADHVDIKEETPALRSPTHEIRDLRTLPHQLHPPRPPPENDPNELATLIALSRTYLTPELAKCIEIQTIVAQEKKAIAEGNLSDKNFSFQALKLRLTFPQTYKVMWKPLGLPSPLALRRTFRPLTWEINEEWARPLRARFARTLPGERECAVCVAGAALRPALDYDAARDRLRGLDEVDGAQRPRAARRALCVWARGLHAAWAQPLACCLLAAGADLQELWLWIDIVISKLFDVGLKVRAVVTDYDDEDVNRARPVIERQPFFTVKNRQIYRLYDWNQVMVAFRDCLIRYNISFGGKIASWDHVFALFEHDDGNPVKLAPGLSARHVRPHWARGDDGALARGVLAAPVAGALAIAVERRLLPPAALGTALLINSVSSLHEILSKKSLPTQIPLGASSGKNDLNVLNDMQILFEDLKAVDKNSSRAGSEAGALVALRGHVRAVRALAARARCSGHDRLPLRAFGSEPLHQFYDDISPDQTIPTSKRFLEAFRKSFVSNVMKPARSGPSEREDYGEFLTAAESMKGVSSTESARVPPVRAPARARLGSLLAAAQEPGALARELLRRCLAQHSDCALMSAYCSHEAVPYSLLGLLSQLERHFRTLAAAEGVVGLRPLMLRAAEASFAPPCPCFPSDYLNTLYMSFRLHSLIDHNNANFNHVDYRKREYSVDEIQIGNK